MCAFHSVRLAAINASWTLPDKFPFRRWCKTVEMSVWTPFTLQTIANDYSLSWENEFVCWYESEDATFTFPWGKCGQKSKGIYVELLLFPVSPFVISNTSCFVYFEFILLKSSQSSCKKSNNSGVRLTTPYFIYCQKTPAHCSQTPIQLWSLLLISSLNYAFRTHYYYTFSSLSTFPQRWAYKLDRIVMQLPRNYVSHLPCENTTSNLLSYNIIRYGLPPI